LNRATGWRSAALLGLLRRRPFRRDLLALLAAPALLGAQRLLHPLFASSDGLLHGFVLLDLVEARLHLGEKGPHMLGIAAEIMLSMAG
jgi:hypothetical protein